MDLTNTTLDPAKLRAARGDRKQSVVAQEAGIKKQQLCNYEKGRATPDGNVLARLCLLYGIDVTNLTTAA